MKPSTPYDRIGQGYALARRPDPSVARALSMALGDAQTVLNVGAGSGSYESALAESPGRQVVALEPSQVMLAQRPAGAAPAVQGVAEALPFANRSFDACMGVLTLHHWRDPSLGLRELLRVARRRIVVLTWLPEVPFFWLYNYFPQLWTKDQEIFPGADWFLDRWPNAKLIPLPIPKDCTDGFLGAYWARPQAYLEDAVRASISTFTKIDTRLGVERLSADLKSGKWHERYGPQLRYTHLDLGYRLLVIPVSP